MEQYAVVALIAVASITVYHGAFECGFVFDDLSAIKDNQDLRPETPFVNIFYNDFWGTPMIEERSHKSYRPLTVLTFRLNYLIGSLDPFGYHLINVILHSIVTVLVYWLCRDSLQMDCLASSSASLLFAVHPVHTEAVTGVVGRAELLSAVFVILAFSTYALSAQSFSKYGDVTMVTVGILIVCATFSKEQGITVAGICIVHDAVFLQKKTLPQLFLLAKHVITFRWSFVSADELHFLKRCVITVLMCAGVLFLRIKVMNAHLPSFTSFDNPAAAASFPARQLTYNYLLPVNLWLLLCPSYLCCDWTMGTIPLVESLLDYRNIFTILFYFIFYQLFKYSFFIADDQLARQVAVSLAFLIIPFLPATNLFFPVGFVVAERVLYIPSIGYCMLFGVVLSQIYTRTTNRNIKMVVMASFTLLIMASCVRTVSRNKDWNSEYSLFMSGLKVNENNAKIWNNVGHALESNGAYEEALWYFGNATRIQPDDIGSHMNVGRMWKTLGDNVKAEGAFRKALDLLPPVVPGRTYSTRVAPNHLNIFINLGNLLSEDSSRLKEVAALYRRAINMRPDYVRAHINLGDVLFRLGESWQAISQYKAALEHDSNNPDIYYNLGVVHLEVKQEQTALTYFNKALNLNPYHKQSLFNSAVLLQESGMPEYIPESERRLLSLVGMEPENEKAFFTLGMLATDMQNFQSSREYFHKAITLKPDYQSALFNMALLLVNDISLPLESIPYLKQNLKYNPKHVKSWLLLGDVAINHMRKLDLAEKCFHEVVKIEPGHIQANHNLCVVYSERGELEKAKKCLASTLRLAPQENYIREHLKIIEDQLRRINS